MKKLATFLALSVPLLASAATNLLSNGSFETGLTGWTVTNSAGTTYPVSVIDYGPPGSAFGEVIPADNAVSLSPDAAGTHGVYFVDDDATQNLEQSLSVAADGLYEFGYSYYLPLNGSVNPIDVVLNAVFLNSQQLGLQSVLAESVGAGVWIAQSGTTFLTAGNYAVAFTFNASGGQSVDVVIDRVYVTAVPEPESFALMLAGLAGVGFLARRRQAR